MTARYCAICGVELTERTDCGGDCVWCMADVGDPDALDYIRRISGPRVRTAHGPSLGPEGTRGSLPDNQEGRCGGQLFRLMRAGV